MKFPDKIEFVREKPEKVIDHLRGVKRDIIKVNPASLCITAGSGTDAEKLFLAVSDGYKRLYPIRETFILKLLKWFNFPITQLHRYSTGTIISVANDFLLNINANEVFVKLENDEALTIVSDRFTDITDLEILEMCMDKKINSVNRNDFFMSINSTEIQKIKPFPGDDCGIGFNMTNSETGFHSLQMSHYILRYICSNGAMVKINQNDKTRLIHYDYSREYVFEYINDCLKEIDEKKNNITERLRLLKEFAADVKIEESRRKLGGILGYNEANKLIKEYQSKLKLDIVDYDGTAYSLFNFITHKAKSYDIMKRNRLEQLAGDIFLYKSNN